MPKDRKYVPAKIHDKVMKEFSHRCAIGGEDNPQLHHIDSDPSNNDPLNLIPLCPNCHLSDQHNPTRAIEPEKLTLLRIYRDPLVLKPQFHPLFLRLQFLDLDKKPNPDHDMLAQQAVELVEFAAEMEMGKFYSKKINELVKKPKYPGVWTGASGETERRRMLSEERGKEYIQQLREAKEEVYKLTMELLRFQKWNSGIDVR